mgnify:CR=1 FL=1
MNIEQFKIFKTIAEVKSFTKAAKKLNFTQPAISTQIKILEQNYGIALFERHNHGVKLTKAGQKFYEYGERILALYGEMEKEIAIVKGNTKEIINIAACETAGNYILPSIIINYKEIYPQTCLRLEVCSSEDILTKIKQKQLDFGIVDIDLDERFKSYNSVDICTENIVLIVPRLNIWQKKKTITVKELLSEPFIALYDPSTRNEIENNLSKLGYSFSDLNLITEFNNYEAIKQAVINSKGVALVPESVVQRELKEGILLSVKIKDLNLYRKIKLIWHNNELLTHAKREFIDFMCDKDNYSNLQLNDSQRNIS